MKRLLWEAYPTMPTQMAAVEGQYPLHRYEQLTSDEGKALTRNAGAQCVGTVTSGSVQTRDAMAQLVIDTMAAFSDKPLITPVNQADYS